MDPNMIDFPIKNNQTGLQSPFVQVIETGHQSPIDENCSLPFDHKINFNAFSSPKKTKIRATNFEKQMAPNKNQDLKSDFEKITKARKWVLDIEPEPLDFVS